MVQKAKLDVLENLPEIEIMEAGAPAEVHEEPLPISREGWAFNKLLLIGAPVLIVVLVIIGALWFYLSRTITTVVESKPDIPVAEAEKKVAAVVNIPVAVEPIKMNTAYFKDFVIDLKDKAGKSKILLCDVAFTLNEEKNIAELENRNDVRNLIYQTVKGRKSVALKSLEERSLLKKELSQELNKMVGDGIVKNVYFINYLIM